jgi:hypothetical protein
MTAALDAWLGSYRDAEKGTQATEKVESRQETHTQIRNA